MTAVGFLLCSFEERLAAQKKEKEIAAAELGFKKPLSKEEKIQKKKQRLAAIGKTSFNNINLCASSQLYIFCCI